MAACSPGKKNIKEESQKKSFQYPFFLVYMNQLNCRTIYNPFMYLAKRIFSLQPGLYISVGSRKAFLYKRLACEETVQAQLSEICYVCSSNSLS